jgi:hypothetical protein
MFDVLSGLSERDQIEFAIRMGERGVGAFANIFPADDTVVRALSTARQLACASACPSTKGSCGHLDTYKQASDTIHLASARLNGEINRGCDQIAGPYHAFAAAQAACIAADWALAGASIHHGVYVTDAPSAGAQAGEAALKAICALGAARRSNDGSHYPGDLVAVERAYQLGVVAEFMEVDVTPGTLELSVGLLDEFDGDVVELFDLASLLLDSGVPA